MNWPDDFINKILLGDCLKVMPSIPDNSIDLVITSPPYNIGIDYGTYKDNLPWKKYYNWCKLWLKEIYRILKNDGRFCLNHYLSLGNSKEKTAPLMILNGLSLEIGFKHHGLAIWEDKTISTLTAWGSWLSASSPYVNCPTEGILILYKEHWKKENKGVSTIENRDFIMATKGVWNLGTDRKRLTPATFPERLPGLCINLLTYEDDLVLDLFLGSGTTAVACRELGRRFIGIEINPEYCEIARRRLSGVTPPLPLIYAKNVSEGIEPESII